MNFLAHIYLSFDRDEVAIGNFIADGIKKSEWANYSRDIQIGIALHHAIDDFTDHHHIVRQSKKRLSGQFGKYAAVLVDIFYDHYLAANWNQYHQEPLPSFVQRYYSLLKSRKTELPPRVQHLLPYMIQYDWLTNYANFQGIERVLKGMSRRASFNSNMDKATVALQNHYGEFEAEFTEFFKELLPFSKNELNQLLTNTP